MQFGTESLPSGRHIRRFALHEAILYVISALSKLEKLMDAIVNNPRDVRFEDACKIARHIGFTAESGRGSHFAFSKKGESTLLNFQKNANGKIPAYQGRQLSDMIQRYRDQNDED